jgi:hypothetical protein
MRSLPTYLEPLLSAAQSQDNPNRWTQLSPESLHAFDRHLFQTFYVFPGLQPETFQTDDLFDRLSF